MMPERIGIIGSMHGVKASSRPNPRKLAITSQKLPDSNSATMSKSLAEARDLEGLPGCKAASEPCANDGVSETEVPATASLMFAFDCIGT